MSGTVLPKMVWNAIGSSIGAAGSPQACAKTSEE
jgi:hypothetical protein